MALHPCMHGPVLSYQMNNAYTHCRDGMMPDWQSRGSPCAWLLRCCQTMPWSVDMHPQGWQLAPVVCPPFLAAPTLWSEIPQCLQNLSGPRTPCIHEKVSSKLGHVPNKLPCNTSRTREASLNVVEQCQHGQFHLVVELP